MSPIEYTGEHLLVGTLGRAFVAIAFASGLLSMISYFLASRRKEGSAETLERTGRNAYRLHSLALLGVIACLVSIVVQGHYEYQYAWKHVSNDLPFRFMFAAFWEGQEGSFLLWGFWQIVLGNLLIRSVKNWEAPVMTVMASIQVFLSSMILGIYVFGHKIGSDPFILIRELPHNIGAPWTNNPNYLQDFSQFQDGQGLAPLLRNYWMTIHPPTLFLGFASTSIPFAYAIAGLWRRNFTGWMRPAIPWSFFGVAALGAGILMGGAWAYEALSFGGFWAWDPVENASLVPWIMLLGAAHLMVINRKRASSLFTTFLLTCSAFILVLYSTFLTRSGVLGDSSVHSFTEDGMLVHLLVYLLFFVAISVLFLLPKGKDRIVFGTASLGLLVIAPILNAPQAGIVAFLLLVAAYLFIAYKKVFDRPAEEEEKVWSREFWVFIGSLVLLLSALQITVSTSKPVMNLLLEPFSPLFNSLYEFTGWENFKTLAKGKLAPPSDAVTHYNKWQVPFAFMVSLLAAVGQYLRYGNSNPKRLFRKLSLSASLALALSVLVSLSFGIGWRDYSLLALLFACSFTVFANLDLWARFLKGRMDQAGPSIAHIGFGLLILGALISQSQSEKISLNRSGIDIQQFSDEFRNNEDMLLFKGDTVRMGNYFVLYQGKEKEKVRVRYRLHFFDVEPKRYSSDDVVIRGGAMFKASEEHEASEQFLKDKDRYWERLEQPGEKEKKKALPWRAGTPGKKKFELEPRVQVNEEMGNVPEPATKRYLGQDVYTHIRFAELEKRDLDEDGYETKEHKVAHGDTLPASSAIVRFQGLSSLSEEEREEQELQEDDIAAAAKIEVLTKGDSEAVYEARPLYIIRDSSYRLEHRDSVPEAGLRFELKRIHPQEGKVTIAMGEDRSDSREFIVLQAIVFPMINILWTGCILMVLGTLLAVRSRIRNKNGKGKGNAKTPDPDQERKDLA